MADSRQHEVRNKKGAVCGRIILDDNFEVWAVKSDNSGKEKRIEHALHTCSDPRNPKPGKDKLYLATAGSACKTSPLTVATYRAADAATKEPAGFYYVEARAKGGEVGGGDWEAIDTGDGFFIEKR